MRNVPNASHISNVTVLRQDGLLNDEPESRWSCQLPIASPISECYMTFDLKRSFILDELTVCKEGQQNLGRGGGYGGAFSKLRPKQAFSFILSRYFHQCFLPWICRDSEGSVTLGAIRLQKISTSNAGLHTELEYRNELRKCTVLF